MNKNVLSVTEHHSSNDFLSYSANPQGLDPDLSFP